MTVIATLVVNRSCKMEFAHEEAAKRLNEPSEAVKLLGGHLPL